MQKKGFRIWAISLVAVGFGLLTIKEGGAILFGGEAAQASAGNYVPFVLWFNFLAGFVYVLAGATLLLAKPRAAPLALFLAVSTILVFLAFAVHIAAGGAFEARTAGAMSLRSLFWIAVAFVALRAKKAPAVVSNPR